MALTLNLNASGREKRHQNIFLETHQETYIIFPSTDAWKYRLGLIFLSSVWGAGLKKWGPSSPPGPLQSRHNEHLSALQEHTVGREICLFAQNEPAITSGPPPGCCLGGCATPNSQPPTPTTLPHHQGLPSSPPSTQSITFCLQPLQTVFLGLMPSQFEFIFQA